MSPEIGLERKPLLIESHYLPDIRYMSLIAQSKEVWIDQEEIFRKQSYRNRCYILTSNKIVRLSVPVRTQKVSTGQVEIAYEERWQNDHWRGICAGYGKAPFFEYFAPELKEILFESPRFLIELNTKMLAFCIRNLGLKIPVYLTQTDGQTSSNDLIDRRKQLNDRPERPENWPAYTQVFGNTFVPNLSILDLLFCEGSGALGYLKKISKEQNQLF
jgi:WbqC-like protein family